MFTVFLWILLIPDHISFNNISILQLFQDVTGTNGTSFITCCSFDSKERHKFSKSNPACTEINANITFSRILKKVNCFSTHNDSTYDLTCFQNKTSTISKQLFTQKNAHSNILFEFQMFFLKYKFQMSVFEQILLIIAIGLFFKAIELKFFSFLSLSKIDPVTKK